MLHVDDMSTHIYAHCYLYVITAKKKQDTLWKISVAVHILYYALQVSNVFILEFLPRCMECSRGIAMGFLSVRPSVCLSVCQTRAL